MRQNVENQVNQLKFEKRNGQTELLIVPFNYEAFNKEMLQHYDYQSTTKYIYQDNINDEITIDSISSYDKMLERLQQKPSFRLLKEKQEQDKNMIFKKKNEEKKEQFQNSKQLEQKGNRENIKGKEIEEQYSIYFVSETIKGNIILATNYDQFQKKMENQYGFTKTTKYIYATDDEEIIIDSGSSYDQMLKSFKQTARTRILKVQDGLEPTEDVLDLIFEYLFQVGESKIFCVCKFQGKDTNQCKLCDGSALINFQQLGLTTALCKEFKILIKNNFQKIKKYIKDNYQEDIKTFEDLIMFQIKLVNFNDLVEFYFKCIKCAKFYIKANIVHVQSVQRPQKPICDKCFSSNRIEGYITLNGDVQKKNLYQEEDLLPNQPPKLMQSSH